MYGRREDQRLRKVGILGVLGVLAGLLAACAGPAARGAPQPASTPTVEPARPEGRRAGDTLRILSWQAPKILNPHLTLGAADWAAARVTYEPLASYDADGNLVPFLAAQSPSLENGGVAPDGKSVTWKLKHEIRWSDGQPKSDVGDCRIKERHVQRPSGP